ncbi:MAG: protein kinase [Cyanosarcina radialis HA8281-LM2]|jgi:serine/threonine-protein kinase|nr:protein kinase [Cyanosarcina radialis HA8281-LM2]
MTSKVLNYRYRVIQELGEGGFGSTFLAEDTQMPSGRRCVIKQLKPVTYNPQIQQLVQQRFQREAAILEDLGRHSQIPTLYAYFQEDEQFYLVQEWVEGKTLSTKVDREGRLSESAVRDILKNILPVLNFVHSKRIVHRDIKPDNIILRDVDNKPVLIDFGAVRETMGTVMTSQGGAASSIVIGTPGFMPAEQAAGRPVYGSDLYSIGLTAIYLLTGKMPQELETDHRTGEIMWHQEALTVSPSLAAVLDKAIEPNARDRYESAKQMLDALQPSSGSVPSSPPQFVPPTVPNQPQNVAPPTEIPPAANPYQQPAYGEQNPYQQGSYQSSTPYQQPANPYQTPPYQGQNPYQQQPSYQSGGFSSGPVGGGGTFNTSVPVPHEIQGWNWGAFLAPQFWPFSNRVWIGLLAWVPLVNMVMPFILGAKGNAWGWRSRQWQSLPDFKAHQKTWTIAGLFLCIPLFVFNTYVNTKVLEALGADSSSSSEQSINSSPSVEPEPSNSPVTSSSPDTTEPVNNSNSDTTNWYAYSSQSGNYNARFPAQPTEQKQNADSAEFILVGYSDNTNKRFYGTAESEVTLPSGATFDVQKGLDGARDSAAKSTNATVISEQQITQNGYPGREVTMRGQNNLGIIQRMIVDPDGPTLYQAIVVAEDGNLTFPEARAFLDSLTID